MFKIFGVILFFPFIPQLAEAAQALSIHVSGATAESVMNSEYVPRQIANVHSIFNVLMALFFLPFTTQFASLILRILKDQPDELEEFKPKYIDPALLSTPELAISQAVPLIAR